MHQMPLLKWQQIIFKDLIVIQFTLNVFFKLKYLFCRFLSVEYVGEFTALDFGNACYFKKKTRSKVDTNK